MAGLARVLIVAGSDSGGGAGCQADLKTLTALGVYGMTAVTAITVQDTLGVHGVHPVPTDVIVRQMEVTLQDLGADAIKTGMLANAEVIRAVVRTINAHAPHVPLVVDPVMVAKGGARLLEADAINALKADLVLRAHVITPNLPEAEALTGLSIRSVDAMVHAAETLLTLGCRAVLLKGGHLDHGPVTDVLATVSGVERFISPRIETRNTHGTGCTLASAIAAGLAQGLDLRAAVARARSYVQAAILAAPGLGRGHGPLHHMHAIAPWN